MQHEVKKSNMFDDELKYFWDDPKPAGCFSISAGERVTSTHQRLQGADVFELISTEVEVR